VKAGSRVQDTDLSGLRLLRDRLGERFMAGFLLNLGELAYRKEERIMVMPLSGLWSLSLKPEPGTKCVVIACTAARCCRAGEAAEMPGGGVVLVAPGRGAGRSRGRRAVAATGGWGNRHNGGLDING